MEEGRGLGEAVEHEDAEGWGGGGGECRGGFGSARYHGVEGAVEWVMWIWMERSGLGKFKKSGRCGALHEAIFCFGAERMSETRVPCDLRPAVRQENPLSPPPAGLIPPSRAVARNLPQLGSEDILCTTLGAEGFSQAFCLRAHLAKRQ